MTHGRITRHTTHIAHFDRIDISEPIQDICRRLGIDDLDRVLSLEVTPTETVIHLAALNDNGHKHIGPDGGIVVEILRHRTTA